MCTELVPDPGRVAQPGVLGELAKRHRSRKLEVRTTATTLEQACFFYTPTAWVGPAGARAQGASGDDSGGGAVGRGGRRRWCDPQ